MSNNNPIFSFSEEGQSEDFSALAAFMKDEPHEQSILTAEGQLAVDVAETEKEIVVVALMAGCRPENLELHLHNDVLTIRGERHSPLGNGRELFYHECYWGKFSRTIVLPTEVKKEMVRAEFKSGVLTVALPKIKHDLTIPIVVVEE